MWKLFKRLISGRKVDSTSMATDGSFYVYRVQSPEGSRDVISLLAHDLVFASGLAEETIVGACTQPIENGDPITEANFQPNEHFLQLLHNVIAAEAPKLPDFQAEAKRQGAGWIYVIDARTPTPAGEVPPHDIIGAFEVRDGIAVQSSYQPNSNHQLFSSHGIFQLERSLHDKLMERLMKCAADSKHSTG
jgi:hypothetical protein